jgi:hypothetical protein
VVTDPTESKENIEISKSKRKHNHAVAVDAAKRTEAQDVTRGCNDCSLYGKLASIPAPSSLEVPDTTEEEAPKLFESLSFTSDQGTCGARKMLDFSSGSWIKPADILTAAGLKPKRTAQDWLSLKDRIKRQKNEL